MSTITETQVTDTPRQPYQAPQLTMLDSADTQGGKIPANFESSEPPQSAPDPSSPNRPLSAPKAYIMSTITETQVTDTPRQPYQAPQLTLLDSADTQGGKVPALSESTSFGTAIGS